MSTRTVFHIRDRVAVSGQYVGRVDYFLDNGRILVRDDAGVSRAFYPDQLQLVGRNEKPAPACPTPAKLQEAIEIIDSLMARNRNGSTLVRLHSLVSSALQDFLPVEDDAAVALPNDELVGELVDNPPF